MAYITLLSDFGLLDASVAITKGILLQHLPGSTIVDITHEVTPFNKRQGAYLLGASYSNFPAGSYHICLMDIFSGKNPSLVLCHYNGHYFFCADNSVLPLALQQENLNGTKCFELDKSQSFHEWLHTIGSIIEQIENKKTLPADHLLYAIAEKKNDTNNIIDCNVIHIDVFGNVVLDVTRKQIEKMLTAGLQFSLRFIQYEEIREISQSYTDVREGFRVCRFNSNGYLEIGIHKGNASELLGLHIGSPLNNIQIIYK